jgi:hypothetical protein
VTLRTVVTALAVAAALVPLAILTPSAAATSPLECSVTDGSIDWGFKESFRSYISGAIARGKWTVSDGATYATPSFSWANGTGTFVGETNSGELGFDGAIDFTGHNGILNTVIANPSLRFIDASRASLLVDVTGTTQEGATAAYRTVRREIEDYGEGLAEKPEIVALNKIDAMTPAEANRKRAALARAIGKEVMLVSGVAGTGVRDIVHALGAQIRGERGAATQSAEAETEWSP